MTIRRLLALLAVLGLIAAGCGGDRGEDESGGVSDDATETTGGGTEGGAGDFGDLQGVCGPNAGGGAVADAGPEEILGVTADAITLGTVSDPGFEGRPGLNIELHRRRPPPSPSGATRRAGSTASRSTSTCGTPPSASTSR